MLVHARRFMWWGIGLLALELAAIVAESAVVDLASSDLGSNAFGGFITIFYDVVRKFAALAGASALGMAVVFFELGGNSRSRAAPSAVTGVIAAVVGVVGTPLLVAGINQMRTSASSEVPLWLPIVGDLLSSIVLPVAAALIVSAIAAVILRKQTTPFRDGCNPSEDAFD